MDTLGALQRVYAHTPHAWLGTMVVGVINDAAFLPDGTLASVSNKELALWDLDACANRCGRCRAIFGSVAASPVGDVIAAADDGWTVFDAATGGEIVSGPLSGAHATAMAFSADGSMLAVGTGSGSTVVVQLSDPQAEPVELASIHGVVGSIAFSPDGSRLAVAGGISTADSSGAGTVAAQFDPFTGEQVGNDLVPAVPAASSTPPGGVAYADDLLWTASSVLQAFDPTTGEAVGPSIDLSTFIRPTEGAQLAVAHVGDDLIVAGHSGVVAMALDDHSVRELPIHTDRLAQRFTIDATRGVLARVSNGIDLWSLDGAGFATAAAVPTAGDVAHLSADGTVLVSSTYGVADIWAIGSEGARDSSPTPGATTSASPGWSVTRSIETCSIRRAPSSSASRCGIQRPRRSSRGTRSRPCRPRWQPE